MKFVFVDEFKIENKSKPYKWYGLCACVIDSSHYKRYKEGFLDAFKDMKWKGEDLKGRYVYSKS